MTLLEIRKRLINKIQTTDNNRLLEEAYRLFELENDDFSVYQLNEDQIQAVNEAREQIRTGKVIPSDQADKEIDEWLGK